MRILQICHKPPQPSRDGGCRAMDAMTRGLIADSNTVKVLTIATEKHPWLPEELSEEYMAQTRIEALMVDTELNRVDALSNILTGDSYNISRFFSSDFDRLLTDVLRKEVFDLIIFESLFTAPYLKTVRHLSDGLAILRTHNVEHRIWEQMAQETEALTKRLYLKHLAERLRGYEVNALKDFDALASISEDDTRHFKSLGCDSPIFLVPFGLDEKELPPPCIGPAQFAFHLGSMDWTPNVQGVQWFVDEVWPLVRRELPEAELQLAGRNFPKEHAFSTPGIRVLGEVENAWTMMRSPAAMVIPLRSGSGMRIKAIEAMAAGRPIVSTSLGMEGIPGTDGEHFFVADDAFSFARRLVELLKNGQKAEEMGAAARSFVWDNFQNNGLVSQFLAKLQQTLDL